MPWSADVLHFVLTLIWSKGFVKRTGAARPAATWHNSLLTIKMLNVKKQLTSLKIPHFSYNAFLYRISIYSICCLDNMTLLYV